MELVILYRDANCVSFNDKDLECFTMDEMKVCAERFIDALNNGSSIHLYNAYPIKYHCAASLSGVLSVKVRELSTSQKEKDIV